MNTHIYINIHLFYINYINGYVYNPFVSSRNPFIQQIVEYPLGIRTKVSVRRRKALLQRREALAVMELIFY